MKNIPKYTKKKESKVYANYLKAEADKQGISMDRLLRESPLTNTKKSKIKKAKLPFKSKKNLDVIPYRYSKGYGDSGNSWL